MVCVKKGRWLAGRTEPLAVGIRIGITATKDLDLMQSRLTHLVARQGCRLVDFLLMLAVVADAGDRHQVRETTHYLGMVLRQPIEDGLH